MRKFVLVISLIFLAQRSLTAAETTDPQETTADPTEVQEAVTPVWEIPTPATLPAPDAEAATAATPISYPDEEGFEARQKILIEGLAAPDLGRWRRGYFKGGDPGKYLPLHAMARLMQNPKDEEAIKYMNDNRSPYEHYHFACVNWSRFTPIFGEILTDKTKREFSKSASGYTAFNGAGGTENHKTMWYTSSLIYPQFIEGERLANKPKAKAEEWGKKWLRKYVRDLYHYGQGEWDSSTYLMFDVNGMLNIYDFHPDPEMRLLARAALDWMITSYAIKYRDGIFTAPNQRGFAGGPLKSIADQTGWLWWGTTIPVTPEMTKDFRYAMIPALSAWRPNKVITSIAQKSAALPSVQNNTKPNYYFGQGIQAKANVYRETVSNRKLFTLGSLWNGGGSQITKLMLTVSTPDGPVAMTGGSPTLFDHRGNRIGFKYADGIGVRDQIAQVDGAVFCLSELPDDDPLAYDFYTIPDGVTPQQHGDWWVMQVGKVYVGLYSLGESSELGLTELTGKAKNQNKKREEEGKEPKNIPQPIIKFNGRRTGFVLYASEQATDTAAFIKELAALSVDASAYKDGGAITCTSPHDRALTIARTKGGSMKMATVTVDGEAYDPATWTSIFDGPWVKQKDGILTVSDGTDGFIIDFSGNAPVYKPYTPDTP